MLGDHSEWEVVPKPQPQLLATCYCLECVISYGIWLHNQIGIRLYSRLAFRRLAILAMPSDLHIRAYKNSLSRKTVLVVRLSDELRQASCQGQLYMISSKSQDVCQHFLICH